MADNTTLNTGTGGDVIATDELTTLNGGAVTGVKVQRVKVGFGSDATQRDVDAANPLPVMDITSGTASTVNSTTTNLAANAVFTGTAEDVGSFSTIMVSVFSSHASATDGLSLQQSSDGTNWDLIDVYTIPAATGKTFSLGVQAKFFRIVYTNGPTLTTSLRIQTLISKFAKKFSSHRPQDARTNDNDFEEQLSYLMGFNGTTWDRLRTSNQTLNVNLAAAGSTLTPRPDNVLRVAMDPSSLLLDTFETLDTTNTWTTSGTIPPTGSAGALTVSAGTAANGTSAIRSQAAFTNGAAGFLNFVAGIVIEAGAVTGNKRVFGLGIPNTTPTIAAPITNGVVFEIQDTDGSMVGAVYSNGSRTSAVAITRPSDGAAHRYAIFYRASRVYFELDGVVVASTAFPNPQIGALPICLVSVNAATGFPATAATLVAAVVGVGDTGRNNTGISDGTFPWRKTQVGKSGGLSVKGAAMTSVSANFAAAGTGTVGPADVSEMGNVTFIVKNQVAATAYTGAPVIVFEQSDDNVSWSPLTVVRSDTNAANTTFTLGANTASTEIMFDAGTEGVAFVRCRVTTGTTANGMTIVITGGGMPFTPVVSTIDRHNAGRVAKLIYLDSFAIAATTETLHTMSFSSANAAATTGTSYNVTTGKTFRVQSIVFTLHTIAGNTTAVNVIVRIRANAAGAAVVGSPTQLVTALQGIAAANSAAPPINVPVPDGWEFPSGAGIGFTSICAGFVATTAAPKLSITVIGYEY